MKKKTIWSVIDTGIASADENMRIDQELLMQLDQSRGPILHFYEWKNPSITYGYFIQPDTLLNFSQLQKKGIDIARRPTGGGIVFHLWDFAFSVLIPSHFSKFSENSLENYAFINQAVLKVVEEFLEDRLPLELTPNDALALDASCNHFCMAKPTKYDVVFHGKKIAGAAQRKIKEGFLHQGTIALITPSKLSLEELLLPGTKVSEAMMQSTFALLPQDANKHEMDEAKHILKKLLEKTLTQEM